MKTQIKELYICDKAKIIADGKCNGHGCLYENCNTTSKKEYAKEYITIYEAKDLFRTMMNICIAYGDEEKAKQYANALKSVNEAIIELKKESESKGNVFENCLYEQLNLLNELL